MPLYEYQCQQCSEKLEAIQKFSDDPYTICPHCGGALKKLISSPAIQFKGSGFYITDYGKSGGSAGGSDSKSSSSSSSSGSTAPAAASSGGDSSSSSSSASSGGNGSSGDTK